MFLAINIAKASRNKVKNFVFISTDKAVRSTNVMGIKRLGELCLQALYANQEKKKQNFYG